MKSEIAEQFNGSRDDPREKGGGHPWPAEVTELLDHLAVELALEYVRLMEAAAEKGRATPDRTKTERR